VLDLGQGILQGLQLGLGLGSVVLRNARDLDLGQTDQVLFGDGPVKVLFVRSQALTNGS